MVGKRLLKKWLKSFKSLKTWQFILLLILTLFVAATALRLNSVEIKKRREAVESADKVGDAKIIEQRLLELRYYSSHHMNTSVKVTLKDSYERDAQKALKEATDSSNNPNGNIYKKAAEVCDPQFRGYSYAYQQCMMGEIAKYPAAQNIVSVKMPVADLYKYSFSSPLWTPDLVGWTIVVAILICLLIVLKLLSTIILSIILRKNRLNL